MKAIRRISLLIAFIAAGLALAVMGIIGWQLFLAGDVYTAMAMAKAFGLLLFLMACAWFFRKPPAPDSYKKE